MRRSVYRCWLGNAGVGFTTEHGRCSVRRAAALYRSKGYPLGSGNRCTGGYLSSTDIILSARIGRGVSHHIAVGHWVGDDGLL